MFLRERSHGTEAVLSSTLDLFAQGSHRICRKAIPHELSLVDMAARRHREQPYLSVNPYGRVPTLEEDGFVLFESTAILNYLEATRPTPPLVPADARGRALVDMHMKLCDLQLTRYAGTIIFPKRFLPKERWTVTAIAESKSRFRNSCVPCDAA